MKSIYAFWSTIKQLFSSKRTRNIPKEDEATETYSKVKRTFIYLTTFVYIFFIFLLWISGCNNDEIIYSLLSFLITSNALLVGAIIIGFLFGIPKKQNAQPASAMPNATSSYYDDNTNLEEISDWLTKIIVGLSLVQFNDIRYEVMLTAGNIGKSFGCLGNSTRYVVGYSTIIFFSGIGLSFGYLWARIKLVLLLTDNRNKQAKMVYEFMNANNRKTIEQAQNEDRTNLIDGKTFSEKVNELNATKPVLVHDDRQKNRWGGMFEREGFVLSANVSAASMGLYNLDLIVTNKSGNDDAHQVAFVLHDTFPSEVVVVQMVNKAAKLNLITYEAFTVGAVVQRGTELIELELDLNNQPGYPTSFYYRY